MEIDHAIRTLESCTYKPGWEWECTDLRKRFENGIEMLVTFDAHDTSPSCALEGWPDRCVFRNRVKVKLMVGRFRNETELLKAFLDCLMKIEEHESREFLKTADGESPFHPHTDEGITAWHETPKVPPYYVTDIQYGI